MSYIPTKQYLVSSLWIRYGLTPRYQNLCSVNGTLQKTSIFLLYHIVSIWSCCKFYLSQIRCWVTLISNDRRRNTMSIIGLVYKHIMHFFLLKHLYFCVFLCISLYFLSSQVSQGSQLFNYIQAITRWRKWLLAF